MADAAHAVGAKAGKFEHGTFGHGHGGHRLDVENAVFMIYD